jgi:hypothetical protein
MIPIYVNEADWASAKPVHQILRVQGLTVYSPGDGLIRDTMFSAVFLKPCSYLRVWPIKSIDRQSHFTCLKAFGQGDEKAPFERTDFNGVTGDTKIRLDAHKAATNTRSDPGRHPFDLAVSACDVEICRLNPAAYGLIQRHQ